MLWFLNILICIVAGTRAHRVQSVLVIFWAYGAYMGVLGLLKYALDVLPISRPNVEPEFSHQLYLLLSNALFFLTCEIVWRLFPVRARLGGRNAIQTSRTTLVIYIGLYAAGLVLYFRDAIQLNYSSFVNYDGSAWSQVTFYSGASLIAILAARRRWMLAVALCAPYLALSSALGIRSFLALSVFPVLLLLGTMAKSRHHLGEGPRRHRYLIMKKRQFGALLGATIAGAALAYALIGASLSKHGEVHLPESNLIEYYFTVTEALEIEPEPLGTESIERFLWGLGSPVFKQIGIRYERDDDPQTIFATYIDDYAGRLDQFFHYPSLWQADTFAALRYWGLALAPFWAFLLIALERVLRRNTTVWLLFLPTTCWVVFMFARGAVGNSTTAMSYVILVQALVLGLNWALSHSKPRGRVNQWNQNAKSGVPPAS